MPSKMRSSRFAGELLVAAELTRLGLSVALHNAMGFSTPTFDMTAATEEGASVTIQVKALKAPNAFIIDPERIKEKVAYVFVMVGDPGTLPTFHVSLGSEILKREKELFGKWGRTYVPAHGRGLQWKKLPAEWKSNWENLGLGPLS